MAKKKKKEDLQDWKDTGCPRDEVRSEWEGMERSTRPGWATFVKNKRENHKRELQKKEFDEVLEDFVALRVTVPNDALDKWLALSKEKGFEPLKVMDAKITGHQAVFYRVAKPQKKELRGIFVAFSANLS